MDWPHIKSLLISLLIATNLMLVMVVYSDHKTFEKQHSLNIEEMIFYLEESGIKLEEEHLDFPSYIPSVFLDFKTFHEEDIISLLGTGYIEEQGYYTQGDYILKYDDLKIIWSKVEHISRVEKDDLQNMTHFEDVLDDAYKTQLAEQVSLFLSKQSILVDYQMTDVKKLGDYVALMLKQIHEGYVIEESSATVWFYNDEIIGLKRNWPANIVTNTQMKYDIITIDRALFYGMQQFESGDAIETVTLVYKLNDQSLLVNNLVSGEAFPYYRFQLKNGKVYYVQAVINP